ncbi:MAG: ATP-dependent DNA helicase RecG, partial [Clostridia bacterium]|nr:ATP-dependent DNA helicase RecG [Clostridia bacterium]
EEDEEKENLLDLKSAEEHAKYMQETFPDLRVGCVHGKLKEKQKDAVRTAFVGHEIDILVATTVVEVGVDIPNANLMIIENADRFGLSQLHQLRGRVGRGSKKAYCVLVSDSKNEKTRERLNVMKTTYDGFLIAEKDLKMRGPGDFFAVGSGVDSRIRQSGENVFRMANVCSDEGLFEAAFSDAAEVCEGRSVSEAERARLLSYAADMYDVSSAALN